MKRFWIGYLLLHIMALLVGCESGQDRIKAYIRANHCLAYHYFPRERKIDDSTGNIRISGGWTEFKCPASGDLAATTLFVDDENGKPWRP